MCNLVSFSTLCPGIGLKSRIFRVIYKIKAATEFAMIFKGKKVELRPPVGEKIQYMSNHSYTVYKRVSDTDRE